MTIEEIKQLLENTPEDELPPVLKKLESDERAGVLRLIQAYKKRRTKDAIEHKRLEALLLFDHEYAHFGHVCGVDEAGAGPLAGPVCAAAVIMPKKTPIAGIDDSKKLSANKRKELSKIILASALTYSIVFVDNKEIDKINILKARFAAMCRAACDLTPQADFALIDGNVNPLGMPGVAVVKGDSKSFSIACASILAKVARDELMIKYHELYPEYGFDEHKGYGTKKHMDTIKKHGLTPIHRQSFL